MFPSLFPIYDPTQSKITDGAVASVTSFCKEAFAQKAECARHYASLATKPTGYYQCPFGFTTRSFQFEQRHWAVTGVVAFPRFDTREERGLGKRFPASRVARDTIEKSIQFLREVERYRADAIESASKVLPQAFHELRKLNAAVLQHAEREINEKGETRSLLSIRSAAELMRNNFDILEALSNIDGIKALPNDSTINLYDLVFKMKRVFQERAAERSMAIHVNGVRPIILGSQKSFPIVPAVLLENAIKYGKVGTYVRADVGVNGQMAVLTVENQSDSPIDPTTCFERGVRFSSGVEGGGFGLFLAREVAQCHNGTIRCESNNGLVRMIVELPLDKVIPQST